jgi:saposin
MGVYQQACEESLSAFTLSLEHDPKTLEQHLPHTSVVVLPTKAESEETNVLNNSNSTCILCEFVMNILSNYIHRQSTEEEIEKSLEEVCNKMTGTLQKECHELMDNYGPVIIATLLREFDVATICRKLNLCTSQMKVELSHLTKANMATCGICDYVSTYVNFALKRDSSEKSLQHALSTVCSHLSTEQSPQCQTLVQLFAPHIRQLELSSGNNFCKQLPICQTPMSGLKPATHLNRVPTMHEDDEVKQVILKNLDDAPQCMLCRYVVSYLDAVLKNNKSEAAVEAALARVCTILPSKIYSNAKQISTFKKYFFF